MKGMRRFLLFVLATLVLRWLGRSAKQLPDPAAVSVQIREIARLETLEVSLYKKITFTPDPSSADTFWGDVLGWARHTFATPTGKAMVFADARLGLDLDKLGPGSIKVVGQTVFMVLPPLKVTIELKPGETEIIGSNLDSSETTQLLDLAKTAFEREVMSSPKLRQRARAAAERAITSLLVVLGFAEVHFVDALPAVGGAS
jgi:hypothetical protein